jgi:hypothetical protein
MQGRVHYLKISALLRGGAFNFKNLGKKKFPSPIPSVMTGP